MSKKSHRTPAASPPVKDAEPSVTEVLDPVSDPSLAEPSPSTERRVPSPAVEPAIEPAVEAADKYLRLAAEYDNYRKRTAKERAELGARAQGDLVKALIDPLDDLARVVAQGPGALDAKTVLDAVEVVDKKMMKALAAAGLEIIMPVGAVFDPALHEAVSTMPAAEPEEDHLVAQVFQPGYLFKGQLLRAARVVVKQWNG